ncbi:MAG: dihydrolipoyl dehydrogenase [Lachnospiraceae bacterium]|nr:dihydrolipoyl dehydrogenase [Lachnospiraceae bacterium]
MEQFDVLVIGGGPGGYSLATAAAKKGLKVAIFEKETLGGTCLNIGCIPTKYLVDKALTMDKVKSLSKRGIFEAPLALNFEKVQKGKDLVVKKLTGGVGFLLKGAGVSVISGEAVLKPDRVVECGGESYQGKHVVIATGSETMIIPIPGHEYCITSTEVLNLSAVPESMVVMGGGVIGLELACAFQAFGTRVTVVEMLPELLPLNERAAVEQLVSHMKKLGVKIHTGAKMLRVEKTEEGLRAYFEKDGAGQMVECQEVLMAVGRKACLAGIDAEALGLELERRCIKVDERQRTSLPGVYAIGDASGGLQLAHAAYAEGERALLDILGEEVPEPGPIPACVYTLPCFASVGLTQAAARAAGYTPVMGTFDYNNNGMALAEGASGAVYVVADEETGRTLGVTIVGENASEMIGMATLAVQQGMSLKEWENTVVAHPSLCEMMKEAALDCFGMAIHK